ncbi:hypothetical protein PFISCL1PPCAC_9248, partial [Pristionchus fissidentatus]
LQMVDEGATSSQDPNTSKLHGLVIGPAADAGHFTVLCGSIAVSARLPDSALARIRPGSWVSFDMDLSTGANQIVCECAPAYKTYLLADGRFQVVSPATFYLDEDMEEEEWRVAYTPYFRFVDDPHGLMQDNNWLEWNEVLLSPSDGGFLLKVERVLGAMAGCIEPGALPGMMPSRDEIEAAHYFDPPRGDYSTAQIIKSRQLGLCIGHVIYERVQQADGSYSGYGSGRGGTGRGRGDNYGHYNRGGRGGNGRQDYRQPHHSFGAPRASGSDGNWRIAQRTANDRAPGRQFARGDDQTAKSTRASVIYTTKHGLVLSMREEQSYEEGDWLTFEKTAKTEMAMADLQRGRDTYPPYILKHKKMRDDYYGKCRVEGGEDGGVGKWRVQIRVLVEFGWLRKGGWFDPFFGKIECTEMRFRMAKKRLEKEKMGWNEMKDEKKDKVSINVWIGMGEKEMMTIGRMSEFPHKFRWEVKAMVNSGFIEDLPLDVARAAGALSTIVL